MRYRRLGRTGLEVSEIGIGGAVFAGTSHGPFDEADAIAAIRTALKNDVNYIDTSRHYGTERRDYRTGTDRLHGQLHHLHKTFTPPRSDSSGCHRRC